MTFPQNLVTYDGRSYVLIDGSRWEILPTCPARFHNTQRAALGGKARNGKTTGMRCVCPRAIQIKPAESRLPGGAPWRILTQCPADKHNTIRAAYANEGPRCVCPRAIEIRPNLQPPLPGGGPWKILQGCTSKTHNTPTAARNRECICPRAMTFPRAKERPRGRSAPLPSPQWLRAGPWKIHENCPAEGHNTVTWARKKSAPERCICPRSKLLYAEYRVQQNEKQRERDRNRKETRVDTRRIKPTIAKDYPEPDWSQGFCLDDFETVKRGENIATSKQGIADRFEMKSLCGICPVRQDCRNWVLSNEMPRGSLGGVYGGLDKWNRQGQDVRIVNGRIRVVALTKGWEDEWV